jgi:hypothetical protein
MDMSFQIGSINTLRRLDDDHYIILRVPQKIWLDGLDRWGKQFETALNQLNKNNLDEKALLTLQGARLAYRSELDRVMSSPDTVPPPPQSQQDRIRGYDNMIRGLKDMIIANLNQTEWK